MGLLDHVAIQFFKDLPYSFNRLTGFNMHRLFDTFFITMRTTPQRISLVDRDAGVILIYLIFFGRVGCCAGSLLLHIGFL